MWFFIYLIYLKPELITKVVVWRFKKWTPLPESEMRRSTSRHVYFNGRYVDGDSSRLAKHWDAGVAGRRQLGQNKCRNNYLAHYEELCARLQSSPLVAWQLHPAKEILLWNSNYFKFFFLQITQTKWNAFYFVILGGVGWRISHL